jgi:putative DNA primase/helicase
MTKIEWDVSSVDLQNGYALVTGALLALDNRRSGNDFVCPVHEDRRPSLGVTDTGKRILVHCSAGCDTRDVMQALGLGMGVLALGGGGRRDGRRRMRRVDPPPTDESVKKWAMAFRGTRRKFWVETRGIPTKVLSRYEVGWNAEARSSDGSGRKGAIIFPYRDSAGKLINLKRRWDANTDYKKTFRLNTGADTDFLWPPDQLEKNKLMLVEGEPDALRLIGLGVPAVTGITGVGGAEKSARVYGPTLEGKTVYVAFDSSDAGRAAAIKVARIIVRYAQEVRIWDPFPGRDDDSDVSDWLTSNGDDVLKLKREIAVLEKFEFGGIPTMAEITLDGKFNAPRLGKVVERVAFTRKGPGGKMWYYEDGRYHEGGEGWIEAFVRETLGDVYNNHRYSEVLGWCHATPHYISTEPDTFVINCRNGLIRWQDDKLKLIAHQPMPGALTQINAKFDETARCPTIDTFIEQVLPKEVIEWWWEWVGYCMVPTSKYQRAVMINGPRDTGKSTLLRLLGTFLGPGAICHKTIQALCDDRFAKADLFGKLANIFADLDAKRIESAGIMKVLISGDPITAEKKYGQPFSFQPYARHIYSANEMPGTSDQSDAYYKRWFVLPMMYKIPGPEQDPLLEFKMGEHWELSGMFNRALTGLRRLEARGRFKTPRVMEQALENYRKDTDTVIAWEHERLAQTDPHQTRSSVRIKDAYTDYMVWCAASGKHSYSRSKFVSHFQESFPGVQSAVKDGYPVWINVKLASNDDPFGI